MHGPGIQPSNSSFGPYPDMVPEERRFESSVVVIGNAAAGGGIPDDNNRALKPALLVDHVWVGTKTRVLTTWLDARTMHVGTGSLDPDLRSHWSFNRFKK